LHDGKLGDLLLFHLHLGHLVLVVHPHVNHLLLAKVIEGETGRALVLLVLARLLLDLLEG
jgi:hypothetical protein